jgi:hypothetical protein
VQELPFSWFWNLNYRRLVGFLGRGIGQSNGLYLHKITQTQKEMSFMCRVEFQLTVPVFVQKMQQTSGIQPFFVRLLPDVISLQLCTSKVVGPGLMWLTLHLALIIQRLSRKNTCIYMYIYIYIYIKDSMV